MPESKPQSVITNGNKEHPVSNSTGPSPRNFVSPITTVNSPPIISAAAATVAPETVAPMRAPVTNPLPMVNPVSRATPTVAGYNAQSHDISSSVNVANRDKPNNNQEPVITDIRMDKATRSYLPTNPTTKGISYSTAIILHYFTY